MTENQSYDPKLLEGTYQYALSLNEKKDWDNAVEWLSVVVKTNSGYKKAADLLHDAKEKLKQIEYEAGIQALHDKRWRAAYERFKKVAALDNNYLDVASCLEQAKKGLELPNLYTSIEEPFRRGEWNVVIPTLQEIVRIDEGFRNAKPRLSLALRRRRVAQQYAEAMKEYDLAQLEDKEVDWRRAVALLEEVNRAEPGYKDVDSLLKSARKRLKLVIHYNKGSGHLGRHRWLRAIWHLGKAYRIDRTYNGVEEKLQQARERLSDQWRKGPFGIPWGRAVAVLGALLGAALTIAGLIFQNQFAPIGDKIVEWWLEGRAIPTPTIVILGIDRTEVYMNDDQLNLEQLPSLTSGEPVELEIIVFDTNGKRYTSDDLICKWSVNPLGNNDERIDTELCKVPYTPSQEYSQQVVILEEVEGPEQQFEPIDPIPMTFNIK